MCLVVGPYNTVVDRALRSKKKRRFSYRMRNATAPLKINGV